MNIKFKSIEINNFLSFENANITLSDCGFTFVNGINNNTKDNATSNGSGKSSIWESIVWAITGDTIRGTKTIENKYSNSDKVKVKLLCNIDGNEVELTRTKNPTDLKMVVNGEDKSGKGIRDTTKILNEYFPDLTADVIGSVIILGQGLPHRFSNNTPSGRKEVLEKLSKSDFMIEDIKTRVVERKNTLTDNINNLKSTEVKLNTQIDMVTSTINTLINKKEELENSDVDGIKGNISELTSKINEYEKILNELKDKRETVSSDINNTAKLIPLLSNEEREEIDKINEAKTPDLKILEDKERNASSECILLHQEIERLDKVTDVCPTCGQKIIGIEKIDTTEMKEKYNMLYQKYNNANRALVDYKDTVKKQINDIRNKYVVLSETYVKELNNNKNSLKSINDEIEKYTAEVINNRNELTSLTSLINSYESQIKDITDEIEKNKNVLIDLENEKMYNNDEQVKVQGRLDIINKISTVVTRDFRGYLLTNIINYIDKKSKEYSKIVFNNDLIDFTLDGNNVSISFDGKEYENLSGGEKQKIDIIIQFALRDMLCKYLNFGCNIIILDELFDNLDNVGCQNVLNLISSELNDIESLFIVTHHSDITLPCDNTITITKGEDCISRVN